MRYFRVRINHGLRVSTRTVKARNAAEAFSLFSREIEDAYGQIPESGSATPVESPV